MYVRFNELTEMERRTYPVLIDLGKIESYTLPFINIVDRVYLMADFKAMQVTLTPVAAMREVIRTQEAMQKAVRASILNRYNVSPLASSSSLQSESKGGEGYYASSRGDSPIHYWERRLRRLAGVNYDLHSESKGGEEYHASSASSESKGGEEYHASSASSESKGGEKYHASSASSESKGGEEYHASSAGVASSTARKEAEPLVAVGSSSSSSSVAIGPSGSSASATSAPQNSIKTFWGGLTGTVSSFLKPPPLYEKTPGPSGLPKRSRQTRRRRRARRRRLTRIA
jgi:hypothetical protein